MMMKYELSNDDVLQAAKNFFQNGQIVPAIKLVRQMTFLDLEMIGTQISLKAAKDFVESGFVIPYNPMVGDCVRIKDSDPFAWVVKGLHNNNCWLTATINNEECYCTIANSNLKKIC